MTNAHALSRCAENMLGAPVWLPDCQWESAVFLRLPASALSADEAAGG